LNHRGTEDTEKTNTEKNHLREKPKTGEKNTQCL